MPNISALAEERAQCETKIVALYARVREIDRQIVFEMSAFRQRIVLESATTLSEREREILVLILDGLQYKEIAERTGITLRTVKFHACSILRKTGAADRRELMAGKSGATGILK